MEDDPISDLRARLRDAEQPTEAPAPQTCSSCSGNRRRHRRDKVCDECRFLNGISFLRWLCETGALADDTQGVPLTDDERTRLSRYVLP